MSDISAAAVGKLRELTGAGLMNCKKALTEAQGNMDAAVDILRKSGVASAAKKADREAKEGVIAQAILPGAKVGLLLEVNCETDFVAKNDSFKAYCDDIAKKLAVNPNTEVEAFVPDQLVNALEGLGFDLALALCRQGGCGFIEPRPTAERRFPGRL